MAMTISEDQQQLDRFERAITLLEVPREIDIVIARSLDMLSEAGIETEKGQLRHEHCQEKREADVLEYLSERLELQIRNVYTSGPEVIVAFFEYVRKRCYDLYDITNAWTTIAALAEATSKAIDNLQDDALTEPDHLLLRIVGKFLLLLREDITVYQGINRGGNHEVIIGLEGALKTVQEVLAILNSDGAGNGSSALRGWRAQLGRELHAEAQALDKVYQGIYCATCALAHFEDEMRSYYKDKDSGKCWPLEITGLNDAQRQINKIIAHLGEDPAHWHGELRPPSLARVSGLASRLDPWKSLLHSLAATYGNSKPMRLSSVRIRYFFPFAVDITEKKVSDLSADLRRWVPGVPNGWDGEGKPRNSLGAALSERLQCLGQGAPDVESLKLSDFWAAAGKGMYGGNRVRLPALSDADNRDDEWEVWVDLSRLENHCLCIDRILSKPTPHELYKALRCPGDYAWDWKYRYEWLSDQQTTPDRSRWRSIDEFAHDVVLVVAQGLTGSDSPQYLKGHFHEMALVTTDASVEDLNSLYGAKLFRTNLHRDAATLEEWLRYPVTESDGSSNVTQATFGYTGNWLSVLDDTTILGIVGNPSWQADSYLEAVQFAASWAPRLRLWNRQLMRFLELDRRKRQTGRKISSNLRELETQVRISSAAVHAEDLCRLPSDHRFLDSILSSLGVTRMENDLERQINDIQLLIAANEKNDQDISDRQRNFFLAALALFGILNVSAVFAVLNAGDDSGFFRNHSDIRWEFYIQIALVLMFGFVWLLSAYFWKKRR
jgi:hypothetical protein